MSYEKFIDDSMGDDNADMTPAQAAQMLDMAMGNGDTAQADSVEPPADTAEADKPADQTPAADDKGNDTPADAEQSSEIDESNAVLLARDGVHTIPYEQLTQSREQTRLAQEAEAAARAELEALKQQYQSQTPSNAGPSQQEQNVDEAQAAIDAGVDPSIFGDFDEEGIAQGIEKLVAARLQAALEPIEQQKQQTAEQAHWDTIFNAHGDADSIVGSVEFDQWRQSLPSFTNDAIDGVLNNGTADQIVELLDNFKSSTNSSPSKTVDPEAAAADAKAKAKAVIDNTKQPVPTSLSDMPGRPGATAIGEQVQEMSGVDALDVMAGWSPEQITQHLNSL